VGCSQKWIAICWLINICLSIEQVGNIKSAADNVTHDNWLGRQVVCPLSSICFPFSSFHSPLRLNPSCRPLCLLSRLVTTFLFIYFDFDFDWISAKAANGRICQFPSLPILRTLLLSSPSSSLSSTHLLCHLVDLAHFRARFAPKKFVGNFYHIFFFKLIAFGSRLWEERGGWDLGWAYKYLNGSCLAWKIIVKQKAHLPLGQHYQSSFQEFWQKIFWLNLIDKPF